MKIKGEEEEDEDEDNDDDEAEEEQKKGKKWLMLGLLIKKISYYNYNSNIKLNGCQAIWLHNQEKIRRRLLQPGEFGRQEVWWPRLRSQASQYLETELERKGERP